MKETVDILIEGHLTITAIKDGVEEVLYDDHNALLPNYKNVVRRALAGQPGYFIDRMKVLKASTELANVPVTNYEFIPLTDNEVKFSAVFNQGSFNDTLDEAVLYSDLGGDFSQVLGLSILKDDQTNLQIDWTLKIINQP